MSKIVEIVGLAGSGKTTLTNNLKSKYCSWEFSYRLPILRTLCFQVVALGKYLPMVLRYSEPGLIVSNIKLLMYIESLSSFLCRSKSNLTSTLVFDQGIIFAYASLRKHGLNTAPSSRGDILGVQILDRYLKVLDGVVVLKGCNETLEERILARNTDHRVKCLNCEDRKVFFLGYSIVFQEIIEYLSEHGKLILEIDTSQLAPEQVCQIFEGSPLA